MRSLLLSSCTEIAERLSVGIADDEARIVVLIDRPGWREAALGLVLGPLHPHQAEAGIRVMLDDQGRTLDMNQNTGGR